MTYEEAAENIRELGHVASVAITETTGKRVNSDNDLMNGLAAYHMMNLRGEVPFLDESFDVVMKRVYELVWDRLK